MTSIQQAEAPVDVVICEVHPSPSGVPANGAKPGADEGGKTMVLPSPADADATQVIRTPAPGVSGSGPSSSGAGQEGGATTGSAASAEASEADRQAEAADSEGSDQTPDAAEHADAGAGSSHADTQSDAAGPVNAEPDQADAEDPDPQGAPAQSAGPAPGTAKANADTDATQVIRLRPDSDATQIITVNAPHAKDPGETQIIKDADATQVISTAEPDATQVIKFDADATTVLAQLNPGDATTVIPKTGKGTDGSATTLIPVVAGRKDGLRTRIAPPRDPGRAPRPARPRREPMDLGHAPAVLTISALGVLMVALGYAGGRIGTGNAQFAYWVGQVVVFTPVVVRLLSRRMAGVAESFVLVMGLALHQYLLKWMYSPDQFRFPDELQHWLGTTIIVQSGELFQPNPALPPAVHFPGLAEMGAALTSMTGLPVTASGVIVAGIAHLIFVAMIFAAVLRASNSPAVAGVACATYATALHYLFFNSMFLYQTAALPFFMLTVWAVRRWRAEGNWRFVALAVAGMGVTTVSHHVTAFAMVLTLTLLAVVELVVQKPRRWSALIMPGAALLMVASWVATVARDVVNYLEAPADQVVHTIENLISGTSEASSTTAAVSIGQLIVQGAGLLALFVLYLALLRDMVQRRDRDAWRWAAVAGGTIFFAGNAVRFLGQNGPEIAARLSTFTYVPISILAAIALVRGVQIIPAKDGEGHRWRASPPAIDVIAPGGWNLYSRTAAGSLMITVLMIGARAGGWPPIGSILPGPYLAGGFERSVDASGIAAADWQRDTLGHDNRVGGDVTSVSLASTYGRQDPVREVGSLYYADEWGLEQQQLVDGLAIQYLVVDKRLSEQLPEGEAYFENDPHAGSITSPLTSTQIGKFDALTGVDRLYDNGTVRVYRMGNL